jgi:hypothetical protein
VIFQTELLYLTRAELFKLLHQIACEQPYVPQGSVELRNADTNRFNIRVERWRGRTCGPADNGRHDISVIAFCPSAFKSGRIEVVAPCRPQLLSRPSEGPASTRATISMPKWPTATFQFVSSIYPHKLSIFSSAPPLEI